MMSDIDGIYTNSHVPPLLASFVFLASIPANESTHPQPLYLLLKVESRKHGQHHASIRELGRSECRAAIGRRSAEDPRPIQTVNNVQEHNFSHHRHGFRGTHVKVQSLVKGELEVLPNLPQHLAQGLFAEAKTYPLAIRYANELSFFTDDRAPGPEAAA